jgi:cell division protein FtsB
MKGLPKFDLSKLPGWMRNRYLLVTVFVAVWLLLLDKYDLRTRFKMQQRIDKLRTDRDFYRKEIARVKQERNLLRSNLGEVERIAREEYLMKRPAEDLFVVVPAKPD